MAVLTANDQCYPSFDQLFNSLEEAQAIYTGDELFEDETFYGQQALRPNNLKLAQSDSISTVE
jgi:hypothetical protein